MAGVSALRGLHAVVTGAAGGIGAAISRELISQGATVHGLDRDAEGLAQMTASAGFRPHVLDLADRAALDAHLPVLTGALDGRCDILVNNVGMSRVRSLEDSDDSLLDATLAVNFIAAFRLTRGLLPALKASGRAAIVNMASELSLVGQANYSAYCASKGALLAWSRALALELAPGIRVNAVCPGPIDTPLLQAEFRAQQSPERAEREEIAAIPLSRLGMPEDIAPTVAFLSSDAARFVTGAAWTLDGGKTAR
jgi:NAD(P)-dependent dehydrogenase (short-subunit alcohol dehydrogenase family)